jgi:threonine/homoserine/homoserine lactone efflux protein
MMGWAAAVLVFWFVMAITPGPNNVLLASSGLSFGMRRTIPQAFGIQAGVGVQILVVGAGLGALFVAQPLLQIGLKVFGSLYVLWLAWHTWRSSTLGEQGILKPIGPLAAAGFQFVNPKTWATSIACVSAFAAAGDDYLWQLGALALLAVLAGFPCNVIWAGFGVGLGRWLAQGGTMTVASRVLAIILAATVVVFWLPH